MNYTEKTEAYSKCEQELIDLIFEVGNEKLQNKFSEFQDLRSELNEDAKKNMQEFMEKLQSIDKKK